ncbi:hypothetical protein NDU88_001490 [Pleurodeles waltl]|uniref:Uncharacterized protein n=1 Tax=Pleurodeles waltl TaxID=8319 RepID=A0AAV7MUU0_PLEWA|nr:hypothetical protein NDU88_001490 [Pleurodeles waltl]
MVLRFLVPCAAQSKGGGGGKQVKLTWMRAHKDGERSRKLFRYRSGEAQAAARAPPQGARDLSPCTVHLAPASGSREAAAQHVIAGRSPTHASNRGARLFPHPVDGTPSSSDLQRSSGAQGGTPGARITPLPPARGPPICRAPVRSWPNHAPPLYRSC